MTTDHPTWILPAPKGGRPQQSVKSMEPTWNAKVWQSSCHHVWCFHMFPAWIYLCLEHNLFSFCKFTSQQFSRVSSGETAWTEIKTEITHRGRGVSYELFAPQKRQQQKIATILNRLRPLADQTSLAWRAWGWWFSNGVCGIDRAANPPIFCLKPVYFLPQGMRCGQFRNIRDRYFWTPNMVDEHLQGFE